MKFKRYWLGAFGIAIMGVGISLLGFAEPGKAVKDPRVLEIERAINGYWHEPQLEKIQLLLKNLTELLAEKKLSPGNAFNGSVFMSFAFEKHPEWLDQCFDRVDKTGSDIERIVFLNTLWVGDRSHYGKTPEKRNVKPENNHVHQLLARAQKSWTSEKVQEVTSKMAGHNFPDILTCPINNPAILDFLWSAFFATGDTFFVERVISVIHLRSESRQPSEKVLGAAALWSLTSNAKQHAEVLAVCKRIYQTTQDGVTRKLLGDLLKKVDAGE